MTRISSLKKLSLLSLVALGAAGVGCATAGPPPELVAARSDYQQAARGPAAQLDPSSLHTAKKALDLAESAFAEDPRDPWVRDQAYIADRKALFADAQGRMLLAQREEAQARDQLADIAAEASAELRKARASISDANEQQQRTRAELEAERQALEQERARAAAAADELQRTSQELEAERTARAAAEEASRRALEDLARTAQVKEDERGLVITLSGQVLFASGKSTLLPAAKDALDNVAEALKANPNRDIIVEGHTDSVGSSMFNEDLSQRRAVAVREYLTDQGVPAEMIRARGRGEEEPVANNGTPEGRANNRRVEIVLSPLEPK